ncbi:signal recognition particle-docking protein FtsY [Rhabdothermincola sediminis]|uniref:signal recognition particle-docking protein FtsY n=1 Tax=Rhabdothermincola sediminis TaxID=2751370 RepID=UPI001AA075C7|nr:signal recognition particle-docking protein FtsY [Rhabdothermincola sediminis]
MEILLLFVVLAVLVGVSLALVSGRRRRLRGLEPPPDAPRVPQQVLDELAERKAEATEVAEPAEVEPAAIDEALREAVEEAVAPAEAEAVIAEAEAITVEAAPVEVPVKPRFRDRLAKARGLLAGYVGSLVGRSTIDAETWEELEEALIRADVGVEPTTELLDHLRARVKDEGLTGGEQLLEALKDELKTRLSGFDRSLRFAESPPTVWLFVGVNGVGKTTTIGKVGKQQTADGHRVVMAAGDTFRAAAAEQLGMWAERAGADIVRGAEGGDPSAVIYDAIESAAAKGADLVLADTAGRLHTKVNLMEELRKVRRVAEKGAGTVTEVLLVLDATTGQNGLVQAREFTEAVELTGVVLTKLDGSAKGGIVVAIQAQLGIPVKLVGLGEGADDLVPFDADEFVEALFS